MKLIWSGIFTLYFFLSSIQGWFNYEWIWVGFFYRKTAVKLNKDHCLKRRTGKLLNMCGFAWKRALCCSLVRGGSSWNRTN